MVFDFHGKSVSFVTAIPHISHKTQIISKTIRLLMVCAIMTYKTNGNLKQSTLILDF